MRRLAKGRRGIYIKREPRLLLLTETGAGTAQFAPPISHGYQCFNRFRPRISSLLIRGQPLYGVRRQKQDEYQREERDQKQTRHG